jgi:DNA-binding NarL/FixJ family response regulator
MSGIGQELMFEAIGISPDDEHVYRHLLHAPGVTIAELTSQLDRDPSTIRVTVERLERFGLLNRTLDQPGRLVPARPDVAVDILVARQRAELDKAQTAARELLTEMAVAEQHRPENLVEVIVGQNSIATRFAQLLQTTEKELLVLDRPPYAARPEDSDTRVRGLLKHGVHVRGIYSPDSLQLPGAVEQAYSAAHAGESSRVHPNVPMKLAISDRSSAILPLAVDQMVDSALVVRGSALLDALANMFFLLWDQALPVVPERDDTEQDNTDKRLLTMLASGMQDDTIARQLNISPRTVGRRVANLMHRLGVKTRFQAGVYAVRNSLITGTDNHRSK